MNSHNCNPEEKIGRDLRFSGYGVAITPDSIFWSDEKNKWSGEKDNCWLIGNGEYYSEIFYCPWCGEKLEPQND